MVTGKQIDKYIRTELDMIPRHDVEALACAVNDMAEELEHDAFELLLLLIENRPIDSLHTHSYNFHTANGRYIIEKMQGNYYEYN
tara:strand:- start:230 stop:484 length:255 start_codon:yes stop_codon:yes gene_type:complete